MNSIPIYLSQEHSCGYFSEKKATTAYIHPNFSLTTDDYSRLIEQGFRRSGEYVYQPQCQNCDECIPVRLPVDQFVAARNQKRCLKKNADLTYSIKTASYHPEHFELYKRYQSWKHPDGTMQQVDHNSYLSFLRSSWCSTCFVEFRLDEQVVAVSVIDTLNDALSAVYTFYAPELDSRSLGVYSILWQINYAKHLKLEWLYLGYWIKKSQKMSYKNQYRPIEAFIDDRWRLFKKDENIAGVYAKI